MEGYLICVQVMGDKFFFLVPTKKQADQHVKDILKAGYKHFEGNACQSFSAKQIIRASYEYINDGRD